MDLEIREDLFSFIPNIYAKFKFPQEFNSRLNLTKGSKFLISLVPWELSEDEEGKYNSQVDITFSVMDFDSIFNPRTSESVISIFGIHSKCKDMFINGTKHRIHQGNSSEVIGSLLDQSGYTLTKSASTSDPMNRIQLNETDLRFLKRTLQRSWMGGRDFLVAYADRFGEAVVTSVNSITSSEHIRFDATAIDLDQVNEKDSRKAFDGLDSSKAESSIPCSVVTKRDLHGSITLFGGSGSVVKGFSNATSSFKGSNHGLDFFDNDTMGKWMPVKDSDFGKPSSNRFVPWADNDIVFSDYHKALDLNAQFWNTMNLNSIEFVCKYFDNIRIGKPFYVRMDNMEDEDVRNKQSTYLLDRTFIISSLVHTFESDQGKLWTKVYGSSFGIDKHENTAEGKFNYVRL
jgi:hypothetical protein